MLTFHLLESSLTEGAVEMGALRIVEVRYFLLFLLIYMYFSFIKKS